MRDQPRVLVVTTFDLDEYVFDSLRAGDSGFLLKDIDPEEIVAAVRTVHAGDALLAPSVTGRLIAEFVRSPPPAETPPEPSLTARERDVVVLVARGLSNGEIARALHLAESTVKTHISHVLTKWDLRDRARLGWREPRSAVVGDLDGHRVLAVAHRTRVGLGPAVGAGSRAHAATGRTGRFRVPRMPRW